MEHILALLEPALKTYAMRICAVEHKEKGQTRTITYQQLHQNAENLAALMLDRFATDDQKPAVIGLVLKNSIDWMVADLACLLSGLTALPLPLSFSRQQAIFLLDQCDGFLLDKYGKTVLENNWKIDISQLPILQVEDQVLRNKENFCLHRPALNSIAKIIHTSGTTSTPKGVMISGSSLWQTLTALDYGIPDSAFSSYLSLVPLSLLLEQMTGVYLPLLRGGTTHFLSPDTPLLGEQGVNINALIAAILQYQPSALTVPPIVLETLLKALNAQADNSIAIQRYIDTKPYITCGGAAVSLNVLNELKDYGLDVFQGYGLSENTSVVSMNTPQNQRLGSVGKPLPHVQVRLGVESTIQIKSSSLFNGYSGLDPSTCDFTDDHWLDTGDIGSLDTDGFLYIQGRKKNIICLPNGRNVSPEQVELSLLKYPHVKSAVVSLLHDKHLVALLVTDQALDLSDVKAWSSQQFSTIENPTQFILLPTNHADLAHLFTVTGRPKRTEINTYLVRSLQRELV